MTFAYPFVAFLRAANITTCLLFTVSVLISSLAPLNDVPIEDILDKHPTKFTPEGFTFLWWFPFFLCMNTFAFWQALPRNYRPSGIVENINVAFSISQLLGAFWPIAFAFEVMWLGVTFGLVMILAFVYIYYAAPIRRKGRFPGQPVQQYLLEKQYPTARDKAVEFWCVQVPFTLGMAWLVVMFFLNVAILFEHHGWDKFETGSSVILTSCLTAVSLLLLLWNWDFFFGLTISWFFLGVAIKQSDTHAILVTAASAAGLIALVSVVVGFLRLRRHYRVFE
jgi:hypothetical protein